MGRAENSTGGTWFVAARLADLAASAGGGGATCCVCGEPVWIEPDAEHLARSCAQVACANCAGTVPGVVLIPPAWLRERRG